MMVWYTDVVSESVASAHCADLVVERIGRAISMVDARVAVICRSHAASIATRTVDDLADRGVDIVKPWIAS